MALILPPLQQSMEACVSKPKVARLPMTMWSFCQSSMRKPAPKGRSLLTTTICTEGQNSVPSEHQGTGSVGCCESSAQIT